MLGITCYASGSSGNLYTVTDGNTTIMIDPGIPIQRVQKAVGYTMPEGVLLTHEHMDHAKAVSDLMKLGVDCYMTDGTAKALGIHGHRCRICSHGKPFRIGSINVSPFSTEHDAAEPVGFLLDDGEDRLLYATDTYYVRYRFPGLTKIMVEVNHSYSIVTENLKARVLGRFLAQRLMRSHFALENVLAFLATNDLSKVSEIWLLHMSGRNSDTEAFRKAVMGATGKPVYIAKEEAARNNTGKQERGNAMKR